MRTAKRTGYQRPAKHKQGEKQDDRFLAMVCFQMALCILAAAVFFAACRGEQGESDSAVYKTAQLLCGQQSERLIDWESLRGQDWLQKIKDFWQGGAAELLERLQKLQKVNDAQALRISEAMVGSIQRVLVTGASKKGEGMLAARTDNNRVVNFEGPLDLLGKMVQVKITDVRVHTLGGTLINKEKDFN